MNVNALESTQDSNQDVARANAWVEWASLMGYAGAVALAVSCALGIAVYLVGTI